VPAGPGDEAVPAAELAAAEPPAAPADDAMPAAAAELEAPAAAPRGQDFRPALAFLAACLAALGQYLAGVPSSGALAALADVAAVAAFLRLLTLGRPDDPARAAGPFGRLRGLGATLWAAVARAPLGAVFVFLGLVLAGAVMRVLHVRGDSAPTYWDIFGLWVASIALYVLGFVRPWPLLRPARLRAELAAHREAIRDVALLLALSLVLRVTFLDRWPDVNSGDEGIIGELARSLGTGRAQHMFGTAWAYSGVYYLANSLTVLPLGGTWGLRLFGALLGALAPPATYLAGRQMFDRRTGLVAGLLLATAHMHIHMSRIGLGIGIDSFVLAWVLFAWFRGLQRRDARWMALAGLGIGASQFIYVGARIVGLVVAAWVVSWAVAAPRRLRRDVGLIGVALGASVVTAAPIIRWAVDRWGDYGSRFRSEGFVQSGALAARAAEAQTWALVVMLEQVRDAFLAFVQLPAQAFYGARLPMIDGVWAALLVLGLGYALWRWRDGPVLMLLWSFAGGLAILALGLNTRISVYRSTVVLPALALLAALALVLLAERGLRGQGAAARWPALAISSAVAFIMAYNAGYYFLRYLPSCSFMDHNTAAASIAARYVSAHSGPGTQVFALDVPEVSLAVYPSVEYLTGRKVHNLATPNAAIPAPGAGGSEAFIYSIGPAAADVADLVGAFPRAIVLAAPSRAAELAAVAAAVPGGKRSSLRRCETLMLEVYDLADTAPAGALPAGSPPVAWQRP